MLCGNHPSSSPPSVAHTCWNWVQEPNLGVYPDLKFKVVKKWMGYCGRETGLENMATDSRRILVGAGPE